MKFQALKVLAGLVERDLGNSLYDNRGRSWKNAKAIGARDWHRGWCKSAITKIVEGHIERTQALAQASPKLCEKMDIMRWRKAEFIPIILSLIPGGFRFHKDVPLVPILQIRNFIDEMPAYVDSLMHFTKKLYGNEGGL